MGNWLQWGSPHREDELKDVENLLQAALQPIPPRPEYVKNLHWRLTNHPHPSMTPINSPTNRNLWIVMAGVLSGFVLLAVGIRVLSILSGDNRLLKQQIIHQPMRFSD